MRRSRSREAGMSASEHKARRERSERHARQIKKKSVEFRNLAEFVVFGVVFVDVRAESHDAFVFCLELESDHFFEGGHHVFGVGVVWGDVTRLEFFYEVIAAFECGNAFGARFVFEGVD